MNGGNNLSWLISRKPFPISLPQTLLFIICRFAIFTLKAVLHHGKVIVPCCLSVRSLVLLSAHLWFLSTLLAIVMVLSLTWAMRLRGINRRLSLPCIGLALASGNGTFPYYSHGLKPCLTSFIPFLISTWLSLYLFPKASPAQVLQVLK